MLDSFGKWLVYLAMVAATIAVGWKQPLRYRFMSTADIQQLEHPSTPAPAIVERRTTPPPMPWIYDPTRRTSLDRENYNHTNSGLSYPRPSYATPYPRY